MSSHVWNGNHVTRNVTTNNGGTLSGGKVIDNFLKGLSGDHKNCHRAAFLQFLHALTGSTVSMTLTNGAVVDGIFHTATPFHDKEYDVVLKSAKVTGGQPDADMKAGSIVIATAKTFSSLTVHSLDLNPKGPSAELQTDSAIQTRDISHLNNRDLVSVSSNWLDPSRSTSLENDSSGPWDQFEANRRLFQVPSTYDENLYTKKLDTSSISKEKMAEAERIAREIEGLTSSNVHLQEERGHALQRDMDEEDLYSGVIREGKSATVDNEPGAWKRAVQKLPVSKAKESSDWRELSKTSTITSPKSSSTKNMTSPTTSAKKLSTNNTNPQSRVTPLDSNISAAKDKDTKVNKVASEGYLPAATSLITAEATVNPNPQGQKGIENTSAKISPPAPPNESVTDIASKNDKESKLLTEEVATPSSTSEKPSTSVSETSISSNAAGNTTSEPNKTVQKTTFKFNPNVQEFKPSFAPKPAPSQPPYTTGYPTADQHGANPPYPFNQVPIHQQQQQGIHMPYAMHGNIPMHSQHMHDPGMANTDLAYVMRGQGYMQPQSNYFQMNGNPQLNGMPIAAANIAGAIPTMHINSSGHMAAGVYPQGFPQQPMPYHPSMVQQPPSMPLGPMYGTGPLPGPMQQYPNPPYIPNPNQRAIPNQQHSSIDGGRGRQGYSGRGRGAGKGSPVHPVSGSPLHKTLSHEGPIPGGPINRVPSIDGMGGPLPGIGSPLHRIPSTDGHSIMRTSSNKSLNGGHSNH